MDVAATRSALLDWYDAQRRDLPWRAKPGEAIDPYAVWVSEVMLQQTRADVVAKRFASWMERFPTVAALAAADEENVLAEWSGLGFYGRARRLHAASKTIAQVHGGRMPEYAEDLRCLHGIGPYTAAAVASIAFGQPVAAIDGNVVRVVARLDDNQEIVDRGAGRRRLEELAQRLVDPDRPGDWNQALMDLGATVCTPRSPDCPACPMAASCQARVAGSQESIPRTSGKAKQRTEHLHFAIVRDGDKVLMVRRETGLLAGTWLPPGGEIDTPLEDHVRQQTGLDVRIAEGSGAIKHVFSHRIWEAHVHAGDVLAGTIQGASWVDPEAVGLSTAAAKLLAQVEQAVP